MTHKLGASAQYVFDWLKEHPDSTADQIGGACYQFSYYGKQGACKGERYQKIHTKWATNILKGLKTKGLVSYKDNELYAILNHTPKLFTRYWFIVDNPSVCKLKNNYDHCPCWCSPCNPDEHKGTCESNNGGECRYPGDKAVWRKCAHFATACKGCGNWWCELHKEFYRYKNCHIYGCKNEVVSIVDDNGVDIPLCEEHETQFHKVMDEMTVTLHEANLKNIMSSIQTVVSEDQLKAWASVEQLIEKETKNTPVSVNEIRKHWRSEYG